MRGKGEMDREPGKEERRKEVNRERDEGGGRREDKAWYKTHFLYLPWKRLRHMIVTNTFATDTVTLFWRVWISDIYTGRSCPFDSISAPFSCISFTAQLAQSTNKPMDSFHMYINTTQDSLVVYYKMQSGIDSQRWTIQWKAHSFEDVRRHGGR